MHSPDRLNEGAPTRLFKPAAPGLGKAQIRPPEDGAVIAQVFACGCHGNS